MWWLFLLCLGLLILGYFTYGLFVEKVFGIDKNRQTPAISMQDGVDYMPLPPWKSFMIQLLDIAGIGPIFGPILAALYGPMVLVWIVLGCIFAGGVHDFMSGMMSIRNKGKNVPEIVGDEMGNGARQIMRLFSIILLILVGVVFVLSPAKLLNELTGWNVQLMVALIFVYYFIATILPIDKIIGKLYPFFGLMLLIMTIGVSIGLLFHGIDLYPSTDFFHNHYPGEDKPPMWPVMFITMSCGAISGFHSTQSPLMARTMTNEKYGRKIFYGAMITEGIIALIWATAGLSFYKSPDALLTVIDAGTPAKVVNDVSWSLLGHFGGLLAFIGVIVLPISTGDTAFRSNRLIFADIFKLSQSKIINRLIIAVPMFILGFVISKLDFQMLWRYFGWANQTLAMLVLWSASWFLVRNNKNHWISTIPAIFMTAVSVSFILQSDLGFHLNKEISISIGIFTSIIAFIFFLGKTKKYKAKIIGR